MLGEVDECGINPCLNRRIIIISQEGCRENMAQFTHATTPVRFQLSVSSLVFIALCDVHLFCPWSFVITILLLFLKFFECFQNDFDFDFFWFLKLPKATRSLIWCWWLVQTAGWQLFGFLWELCGLFIYSAPIRWQWWASGKTALSSTASPASTPPKKRKKKKGKI